VLHVLTIVIIALIVVNVRSVKLGTSQIVVKYVRLNAKYKIVVAV